MTNTRPTISLVTPNYNGEQFLETTLRSVLDQSYEALDYVLVDGASTDGSAAILKRHEDQVSSVIIEPDNGHADAINKGFAATQGEIMGWINSDDVLLPGCLSIVSQVFERYPEIEWITGLPSTCDSGGRMNYVGPLKPWSRLRFLAGDHLWIQQESTFWRRSLWDRAGGALDTQFDVANDFDLWARFFRHADLYSVDSMLGCFRIRDGQRSVESHALYMREVDRISETCAGARLVLVSRLDRCGVPEPALHRRRIHRPAPGRGGGGLAACGGGLGGTGAGLGLPGKPDRSHCDQDPAHSPDAPGRR
jgi:glycosyltransferase involved in cell wall biosynthesis